MASADLTAAPALDGTFLEVAADSEFPLQNIPFGVVQPKAGGAARCATRIGDFAIDLSVLGGRGLLGASFTSCFGEETLNTFMRMGRPKWRAARWAVQTLFGKDCATVRDDAELRAACVLPLADVEMRLPARIGDYTDFYSSKHHATNVGTMFRGKDNALQPNWTHLPVGYHGRSSSVVVSGTPVRRPYGQLQKEKDDPKAGSVFGPCRLMDFELEMGAFIGGEPNEMGEPVSMAEAEDRIFGLVLMNDWSARDVQKWEYVPLGPFTAKNLATTISPWVVTLDALEPFTCPADSGKQDPEPLPYLRDPTYTSFDIKLGVAINREEFAAPQSLCTSNFRYLYWTVKQQLVHHSVTGCNMQPGDLLGSGTISGPAETEYGSMLELSWRGAKSIPMPDGTERKFLKDGDDVVMTGVAEKDGLRVGFGVLTGPLLPAKLPACLAETAAAAGGGAAQ